MTTTTRGQAPRPATADDELTRLRGRRHELRAERARSQYLRRLLQARLDLAVAAAVGVDGDRRGCDTLLSGLPLPPTTHEVELLIQRGHLLDLGTSLPALREALQRLSRYEDALERACEDSTEDLVDSLMQRPRACLIA